MALSRVAKIFLVFVVYCALDPFNHSSISKFPDFETYKIDMPPLSSLPKERDRENLLQNSEIRFLNEVQGPESIAFDPQGRGPYTGVADGRILFWDGTRWTDFAYTSNNRSVHLQSSFVFSQLVSSSKVLNFHVNVCLLGHNYVIQSHHFWIT